MEERKTEQSPRGGWRPGFYMRPKHVGLVFCVALVGCMVTFGVGFIVGMGYKASEQISPYAAVMTAGGESVKEGRLANAAWNNDEDMTFYDSLINPNKVPMETNQAPEAESQTPAPARTPIPASPVGPEAADGTARQSAGEDVAAADRSRQPAPVVVPAPVRPQAAAAERDADRESPAAGDAAASPGTYSVQVASFLSLERAERMIEDLTRQGYRAYIHPFEAPGQPLWYRVKVGKFADRATASLTMKKLDDSDAMITRD